MDGACNAAMKSVAIAKQDNEFQPLLFPSFSAIKSLCQACVNHQTD